MQMNLYFKTLDKIVRNIRYCFLTYKLDQNSPMISTSGNDIKYCVLPQYGMVKAQYFYITDRSKAILLSRFHLFYVLGLNFGLFEPDVRFHIFI